MKVNKFVLAVLMLALIYAAFAPSAFAGDFSGELSQKSVNKDLAGFERNAFRADGLYMVKADIAATVSKPGIAYKIEDGYIYYTEELRSPLVYGNIVSAVPISEGEFSGRWAEVRGGAPFDEESESSGYVDMAVLVPMPDVEFFNAPEPCRFTIDSPELFLLPGSLPILDYTLPNDEPYFVLTGEVTDGLGVFKDEAGRDWTLLRFNTRDNYEFAFRYAWTRSGNVTRLSQYEPDHTKVDPALVPRMVRGFGSIEDKFYQSLLLNGFALDATPIIHERISLDDLVESYPDSTYSAVFTPNFVTTDLFLHVFHLVFSRNLKKIEEFNFAPAMGKMLPAALDRLGQLEKSASGELVPLFNRARDFLTIPAALIEPADALLKPSETAREEINRILKAEGMQISGISGKFEDYTFYKPRGHYASSEKLSRYFRAMAYLGGMSIPLNTEDPEQDRENAALTALLCEVFEDQNLRKIWNSLYEPLSYLIGAADDPSLHDFGPVVKTVLNGKLAKLADSKTRDALREAFLDAAPTPRIIDVPTGNLSQEEREEKAAGFRLLGRRFVLDAWVFARLTSPNVGSDEAPRNLPKVADVMAALGSGVADKLLEDDRQNIPKYAAALEKVKVEVHSFFEKWDGTFTSAWLGTLGLYLTDKDSGQFFWNAPLWEAKKLLTASASWAELKHDTVLYSKQSYTEMGAGGEWQSEPFGYPVPLGYVEPSPRTFDAITVALSYLLEIVEKFGLGSGAEGESEFGNSIQARIEALLSHTETFRDIAEKEVNGEPLSRDDYLAISLITSYLNANLLLDSGYVEEKDLDQLKMALVTDVATDGFMGRVLHVATGTPRRLYVFVNDKWGGARVTIGYTYSFYEFPRSLSDGRMTDEEWKGLVYDKARQEELEKLAPIWSESLFVR